MTIIHASPLPDVEIPDVTDHRVRAAPGDELADKAAFIEGPTGRVVTFGELADAHRPLRRRARRIAASRPATRWR